MAQFQPAVNITLQHEGGFFHNRETGEVVNHGITLAFVRQSGYRPDAGEEFIRNLGRSEAIAIYQTYFWDRNELGSIDDQALANKTFDLTVNMGPAALKLLQSAANDCGGQCTVDGVLGPISLGQINALDPCRLLQQFKVLAAARYRAIAADHSDLAADLQGWLNRLNS